MEISKCSEIGETNLAMPPVTLARTTPQQHGDNNSRTKEVKVSIIIQAYNTADYLPECLDSAIRQTLEDIELIVIDDASSDNSLQIIQDYAQQDGRIKVIAFEHNQGLGVGRNIAMQAARGHYLMFLDSDDWLEPDCAAAMHRKAADGQHDMVMCGYTWHLVHDKSETRKKRAQMPLVADDDPHFLRYLIQQRKGLSCMSWQFIFSKKMVTQHAVAFAEGVYFQDVIFTIKSAYHAKSIGVLPAALYNYRYRSNSAVQFASKKKIRDLNTSLIALKSFLEKEGIFEKYQKEYLIRYLQQAVCSAFFEYFKLPKNERDAELDEYMDSLKKSGILCDENALLMQDEITCIGEDEPDTKNSYIMFHNALLSLKNNYHLFRYTFKAKYYLIKAWLNIIILIHQAKTATKKLIF